MFKSQNGIEYTAKWYNNAMTNYNLQKFDPQYEKKYILPFSFIFFIFASFFNHKKVKTIDGFYSRF